MNKLQLLGRLTAAPEVRYTPNGKVVAQFTLAVNRKFKTDGQPDADFVPVVIWGKQAEQLGNSVSKGERLLVCGRLQIRSYEAKDGTKRNIAECVAEEFEYIEKKGSAMSSMGSSVSDDVDF